MIKRFVGLLIAAALMAAPGLAADLTEDAARRFVASLDAIEPLSAELEAASDEVPFDPFPKKGEPFAPYTQGLATMKEKLPDIHKRLSAAVKTHGFSASDWAATGDKVMLAYMGLELDKQGPEAMAQFKAMDEAMLDQMPPQMRERIERVFAMVEAAADAPDADKKAIAAVMDDLTAYMEREEARR